MEPVVGALLKPPQGKRCSSVPAKPELHNVLKIKHVDQMDTGQVRRASKRNQPVGVVKLLHQLSVNLLDPHLLLLAKRI